MAVETVTAPGRMEDKLIGARGSSIIRQPLMECVAQVSPDTLPSSKLLYLKNLLFPDSLGRQIHRLETIFHSHGDERRTFQ